MFSRYADCTMAVLLYFQGTIFILKKGLFSKVGNLHWKGKLVTTYLKINRTDMSRNFVKNLTGNHSTEFPPY
jgi:hypothetical protein